MSLTPGGIAGTLLAFAVAAVCIRLGFWQLHRRAERAAQNVHLEARLSEAPVPLAAPPADTAGLLYRRVTLSGRYDHGRSMVMPGRALRGTPGVHVVTPLLLEGGGGVLVNRGWLPSPDAATVDLSTFADTTPVRLTGLALPFPGTGSRAAPDHAGTAAAVRSAGDTFRVVWYVPDEPRIRAQVPYRLGAVLVQALPAADAPRFPERLQPPPLDPGPHSGYAVQWFSFASIAIGGWFLVVLKARAPRAEAEP